jgi:hypothetical protein
MSDFFTRLAGRILGVAEVVRPTMTPLFAPEPPSAAAPWHGPQDVTSEVEHQPDAAVDPETRLPVAPPLRPDPERRWPDHDVHLRRPGERTPDPHPSVTYVRSPGGLRDGGRVAPVLPPARVLSPGVDPLTPAGRPQQVDADDSRPPVAVEPRRAGATERAQQTGPDASRSAETTIRVTIGRVEVRAVIAPQPVPRPRVAPRPPTLSLDDYLRQRSSGRR